MQSPLAAVRSALWNDEEGRLRAPLRLGGHLVLLVVLVLSLPEGLAALLGGADVSALPPVVRLLGTVGVLAAATAGATVLAVRYLDRRTFADVGLGVDRAWWRDLAAGLALGAALQTAILGTYLAAGWTRVDAVTAGGPGLVVALALGAVAMLLVGAYEELLFRGYWLVNVAEGLTAVPRIDARWAVLGAAAVTSLGFGLVHGANPNATLVSTALIVGYGAYLAVGYLLTGDLALPVGFHAAWNYAQAFLYGFPVSGLALESSLLATSTSGPPALTGGAFGPEAGLVGAAWVLASLPLVWWYTGRTREDVGLRPSVAVPELRE